LAQVEAASRIGSDRLDDLFKWLLAPTTFLMLISWNETNYWATTGLAHPELEQILHFHFETTDLLIASRLLTTEVTVFGVSVLLFMAVAMKKGTGLRLFLRFCSLWGLLFTLTLIWFEFAQAEWPLILLPTPTGVQAIIVSSAISFFIALVIVLQARSEDAKSIVRSLHSEPDYHSAKKQEL
jgi:hypothetical protein